ncbi:MAG TPA: DUF2478 domain-containing protein [Hyphomicrobium sp.]|nr:DUF2478 domain-containing protein [Hyphomicrobium sp.]
MLDGKGNFARVVDVDSATAQRLFADAVWRWRARGLRVAGVIEETHGLAGRACTAGVLRDVATGERHSIFLDILPQGRVCHIDARGAESAGASVLAGLADCDVVVLSKFGKLEADGRGLAGAFQAAAAAGKPVLTWVGGKHLEAWDAFEPDGKVVAPSLPSIGLWWSRLG